MKKSENNASSKKMSGRTALLRAMMQKSSSQVSEKLKELKKILIPYPEGIPLKEAAEQLGISTDGVKTTVASTQSQNEVKIFLKEKGQVQEYYIKLEFTK